MLNVLCRMECEQLRYEGAMTMNWPRAPPPLMPPRLGLFGPGPRPMPFGPQHPPMVNFVSLVPGIFWLDTKRYSVCVHWCYYVSLCCLFNHSFCITSNFLIKNTIVGVCSCSVHVRIQIVYTTCLYISSFFLIWIAVFSWCRCLFYLWWTCCKVLMIVLSQCYCICYSFVFNYRTLF